MKLDILEKAAALALSGAIMMISSHFSPSVMTSDAAVNKVRVSVIPLLSRTETHITSLVRINNDKYVFTSK